MRRIYLMLLSALTVVLLNSCVLERVEKPSVMTIAYENASVAASTLRLSASLADICRVVDMWYMAPTEEERYIIEDEYLQDVKMRVLENGQINIGNVYIINTFGKSLKQNHWEVTPVLSAGTFSYEVTQLNENDYTVLRVNNSVSLCKAFYQVTVVEADKYYKVACEVSNIDRVALCFYDAISFETVEPLLLDVNVWGIYTPFWNAVVKALEGEMVIMPINKGQSVEPDVTRAVFSQWNVELTFRDETNDYWDLEWNITLL